MPIDPYARTYFRGKPLDNATAYALMDAEKKLGYPLTILQGIGGASASGGTHLDGRAVDLSDYDGARKVRVLRDIGFFAWYRPELPGVWGPHVHAGLIFEDRKNQRNTTPALFDQLRKYDAGQDGLAGSSRDPNPYRPSPLRVYTLAEFREDTVPEMNDVEKARDSMIRARNNLGNAAAYCKDAAGREVVQDTVPWLNEKRKQITDQLDGMPKK